jgi:hypothetical protein
VGAALAIIEIIIVMVIVVIVSTGVAPTAAAIFVAEADVLLVALRPIFASGGVVIMPLSIVPAR